MIAQWQSIDYPADYSYGDFHENKISPVQSTVPHDYMDMKPMLLNLDSLDYQNCDYYSNSDGSVISSSKKMHFDSDNFEFKQWQFKRVEDWHIDDTRNWLLYAAKELNIPYRSVSSSLPRPGMELAAMLPIHFKHHDAVYGEELYKLLHEHKIKMYNNSLPPFNTFAQRSEDELSQIGSNYSNQSDRESDNSTEFPIIKRTRPGRPRSTNPKKKNAQRQVKLWEFVKNLLHDPKYCPRIICWENYKEAKFRFVKSEDVAKLWGDRKGNKKMNYEKFSRAMRYYYPSKIFTAVNGQRLVYQFGKNATGWQTDNPNFKY